MPVPLFGIDGLVVPVLADADAARVLEGVLSRLLARVAEDVDTCDLGASRVDSGGHPRQPSCEKDSRERGLVCQGYVDVLSRRSRRAERQDRAAADALDVELADRSSPECVEDLAAHAEAGGDRVEQPVRDGCAGVEQRAYIRGPLRDPEGLGDDGVFVPARTGRKIEAGKARVGQERVGGDAEITRLGPGIRDPSGQRRLSGPPMCR